MLLAKLEGLEWGKGPCNEDQTSTDEMAKENTGPHLSDNAHVEPTDKTASLPCGCDPTGTVHDHRGPAEDVDNALMSYGGFAEIAALRSVPNNPHVPVLCKGHKMCEHRKKHLGTCEILGISQWSSLGRVTQRAYYQLGWLTPKWLCLSAYRIFGLRKLEYVFHLQGSCVQIQYTATEALGCVLGSVHVHHCEYPES